MSYRVRIPTSKARDTGNISDTSKSPVTASKDVVIVFEGVTTDKKGFPQSTPGPGSRWKFLGRRPGPFGREENGFVETLMMSFTE